jgi:hypothetical protein
MKARRLKALGFALLGSLALLFAGCGQQAGGGTGGGGTGNGAVTSVGIQLPQPPAGGYNGVINVNVTVNEGAQVRRVVLKVDGQQVSQIDVAGLRPQGINYTLLLDTAQLDPATKQPRFRNGTHTLTVEVTDVNNNTRSASAPGVIFLNQDLVRGVEVSQTNNPRAPVTRGTTQWYGNGDVLVTVDIVNYSGATYSLSGNSSPFNLQASGGQGGSLSGYEVRLSGVTATTVSGQPQLRLAKSANSTISTTLTAEVHPSSSSSTPVARKTFGLDNVAPSATGARVEIRRVLLEYNFADLASFGTTPAGTSQTLFRGAGASDTGVGGVTYQVAFKVGTNTIATATLPDYPSPGVTVSGLGNFATYAVEITAVEDALGNKQTLNTPIAAGSFQLADATINLSGVTVNPTNPNASAPGGGTFNVSFTPGGGFGALTAGVALKLGDKLLSITSAGTSAGTPTTITTPAYFGAQYVLYVVDQAGNFVVQNLSVTVSQSASDNTPPTITVSLPSSVAPSGTISVSGTHSDPPNTLRIFRSHGSLGGFEWYLTASSATPFSSSSYSFSVSAPDYTGPLGVVVLGWDSFKNLGSATGTVNVQQP